MRADAIGMFWQDDTPAKRTAVKKDPKSWGLPPPVPDTGWRTPTEFPNLSAAKVIGFDTETYDPELLEAGPGWARGRGHIIGISIAVEDGTSWYFPMRHQVQPEHNMDPQTVLRWAATVLGTGVPKVGANLIYDVGWLRQEGVRVGGPLYDVQFAEALLDSEAPQVNLDLLAHKYLNQGKETNDLYEWLARWNGGKANDRQRAYLYATPPVLAGPYAEADAALPIRVLEKQWTALRHRGVLDLFQLECRSIPLLVDMRFKGAPVDVARAEQLYDEMGKTLEGFEEELVQLAGQVVNPNAGDSIGAAFRANGLELPRGPNGKPTTGAEYLEKMEHPLPKKIIEWRRFAKVRNTFVKSYILDKQVNGRVYCEFHPLKSDEGGTRSGRFSSSNPNLQNIPTRSDIGQLVRELFITTGKRFVSADYSQIEYRMLAHHAVGPGSEELRKAFRDNPDIDYHSLVGDMIKNLTGQELKRAYVKNINFGLIYGMAQGKLARMLGLATAEAEHMFQSYHAAAPFARETMAAAADEVERYGYVTTLLGRKSDFTAWTSKEYSEEAQFLSYEAACQKWGVHNIKRGFLHKALNRKLQGGAADVMKIAMVSCYEQGIFAEDACGIPILTVHDELNFDDHVGNDEAWNAFKHTMETAAPVGVPVRVDVGEGKNWAEAH